MNTNVSKLKGAARGAVTLVLLACAGSKEKAATDTLASVDTVKPAPVTAAQPDSTQRADTTLPSRKPPRVGSVDSVVKVPKPPVQAKDTAHLGRDSAIKIDVNDPRRTLPTVPATPPKKPQEHE
ncbi:MAG TPA: hypothetical protein VFT29_02230 [Gemmatimonadaceae bacterium]|nr:hypothetical protein [Gemmatimonadaceae bacterium]